MSSETGRDRREISLFIKIKLLVNRLCWETLTKSNSFRCCLGFKKKMKIILIKEEEIGKINEQNIGSNG